MLPILNTSPLVATMPIDKRFRFSRYLASLPLAWNCGVKTPVKLKTWRRSVRELPRSRRRLEGSDRVTVLPLSMLFCSGASSIACDHVYVAKSSYPWAKRLCTDRFSPLYSEFPTDSAERMLAKPG